MSSKTIAAVSTPHGKGGIAVIRISGNDAVEIASKVFRPASGLSLVSSRSSQMIYGKIISPSTGNVIDDGMAVLFRSPASFTGEDTAEIDCHGGILITRKVLEAVFEAGAFPAGPGEFTKRAFVNGKLALTKAQAVIDTINAENEEQLSLARSHMEGGLSRELSDICLKLKKILSQCYVLCDYPDEDLTDMSNVEMEEALCKCENRLQKLLDTYKQGHAIAEGVKTVIVGRPNVGKSSLLNSLLGYDRAIVTNIPGTTRDTLEEKVYAGNVMLDLCDTAGIRTNGVKDEVELIGIQRSIDKIKNAELIIAVFDSSENLSEEDIEVLDLIDRSKAPKIALLNKCDLEEKTHADALKGRGFEIVMKTSFQNGIGCEELKKYIENIFFSEKIDYSTTPVISSAWQKTSLERAIRCIDRARTALRDGVPADIVGLDAERAAALIDESDGRKISDDIVHGIFSSFCVGK